MQLGRISGYFLFYMFFFICGYLLGLYFIYIRIIISKKGYFFITLYTIFLFRYTVQHNLSNIDFILHCCCGQCTMYMLFDIVWALFSDSEFIFWFLLNFWYDLFVHQLSHICCLFVFVKKNIHILLFRLLLYYRLTVLKQNYRTNQLSDIQMQFWKQMQIVPIYPTDRRKKYIRVG